VAIGITFGGFFWAVLTSVGLGIVFETVPLLPRLMGVIGVAYLLWLGFKRWHSVLRGTPSDIAAAAGRGFWRDTQFGLMVTATNPKVALLWISLSTFVCAANASFGMLLVFASVSS
jgi:threonine/homoserine/homoserine lactone efflux protein